MRFLLRRVAVLIPLVVLSACSTLPQNPAATLPPAPTVDVEATVQARVQQELAKAPTAAPTAEVVGEAAAAGRLLPSVVRVTTSEGMGSGVAIGDELVLTNHHVVGDDTMVTVQARNAGDKSAKVLVTNSILDVALVSVPGLKLPAVPLADLTQMKPGEPVLAIGYPLDLKGDATVTRGLFSAVRVGEPIPGEWVQTDAAVNPGNSGGPLANLRGEVVGLITMRRMSDDLVPVQGINFALSSTSIREVLPTMLLASGIIPPGVTEASPALSAEIGDFLQQYDNAESQAFSKSDVAPVQDLASPSLLSFVAALVKQQKAQSMRRESTLLEFKLLSAYSLPGDLYVAEVHEKWDSKTYRNNTLVEDEGATDQPQVALVKKAAGKWQLAAVQFKEVRGASPKPTRTPVPARRPTPTPGARS